MREILRTKERRSRELHEGGEGVFGGTPNTAPETGALPKTRAGRARSPRLAQDGRAPQNSPGTGTLPEIGQGAFGADRSLSFASARFRKQLF